jgi:methylated-DNA-protein-cysteine methyltransferase-like protein
MSSHVRVYDVVRRIPRGRVATYGGVALEAGLGGHARQVGYALAALGRAGEGPDVPWHRVINARGEISARAGGSAFEGLQRQLLEADGIVFGPQGRIDLERYGWP